MFTKITEAGFAVLQQLEKPTKLRFTHFKMGLLTTTPDIRNTPTTQVEFNLGFTQEPVTDNDPAGTLVGELTTDVEYDNNNFVLDNDVLGTFTEMYTGSDMTYLNINNNLTVLKMFVPPEVQYFKVNSVLLYVSDINDVETPFILSYSLKTNPKFSSETNRFGTKYYYMLQLDAVDRDERFDLSNLALETVDFFEAEHHYDLKIPAMVEYNQLIVRNHTNIPDENQVFVINSQEQFFGVLLSEFDVPYQIPLELDGEALTLGDEPLTISNNTNKDIVLTRG